MRKTITFAGLMLLAASDSVCAGAASDSGALDSTFGSAGKVQLAALAGDTTAVANDTVVQPDGKILIAGYDADGAGNESWRVTRLNVDGSLDTSFSGGNVALLDSTMVTRAQSIALLPDGRIIVAGTLSGGGYSLGVVYRLTATGVKDATFNAGSPVSLYGATAGDNVTLSRASIESDGHIDVVGTSYDHTRNVNRFYFARISGDGTTVEPFTYEFGSGNNQDDHALDLAVDNIGRYVVVGYHRGAAGNYDCAAIRIAHDLHDVDNGFGSGGQTILPFDLGGDNGDFCNAVVELPHSNFTVLGGYSTAATGSGTYQAATLAMLDANGNLYETDCVNVCQPAKLAFGFNGAPSPGLTNAVTKLIVDAYDTSFPQLLVVGWGYEPGSPYGTMFGVARFNLPVVGNFAPDPNFAGDGAEGVYFAERPSGFGTLITTNYAYSGAFANGKLVVVGSTQTSGGTSIAATRVQALDGIFKSGLENFYY